MNPLPVVPGYEILQLLGGGPLTSVYSARDRTTDEPVAVKVLRPEWEEQPAAIKLLQREARVGLSVQHRHLVRLDFAHVTRSPYFLVMEMLAGEALRKRLRRDYRMEPATAVWIVRQTAEALAALHRKGFVHGDVKPDNIRLVDDGTAVLIDLGFAHRPGENQSLLREGYVLGTVNYLAPELCSFESDGDRASDVFSLGVTLYEMLSGRLPYPSGTLEQTLRRHRCDPPVSLNMQAPALPRPLVGLVERMLARRPEDRPAAAAVVQELIGQEIAGLRRRSA